MTNNGLEADWPTVKIGELNVIKGDFYKTGNIGQYGKSKFLIKGKWGVQS
jgi:hypothetical protein